MIRPPPRSPLFPYPPLSPSPFPPAVRFKLLSARRDRTAAMPFIMLTALIDMISIGLIIPVLPALVGSFTGSQADQRSEEHTSELQSLTNIVCRLLLEKKNKNQTLSIERAKQLFGPEPVNVHPH